MLPIGSVFGLMMTFLVNARSRALLAAACLATSPFELVVALMRSSKLEIFECLLVAQCVAEDQDKWFGKSNRVIPKQFLPEAPAALRNQSGTSSIPT
jgi:hypothetical protein